MKCLIISGGQYYIPNNANNYDYIIVCDKGYEYAIKDNVRIDLLLGDFDSNKATIDESLNIEKHPIEKDDTDTLLAIKNALSNGYKDITICCCLGGRLDHLYANMQAAAYIAEHNAKATFISEDTKMYCFKNDSITIKKEDDYSLSIFSITDKSEGVSIKGTKYEANNITLTNTFPLGVSNYWLKNTAEINCANGILLIICSSKKQEH